MASEKDVFGLSGPLHQNTVDWNNPHHRRSVAACLVQGVYVQERDRQQNRQGPQALGPPWWLFFHFQLRYQLVDDVDYSIFGAVYELQPLGSTYYQLTQGAPRYVIAFRGTNKGNSHARDLKLDLECIRNALHLTSRSAIAMQAVRDIVAAAGGSNVWLAGHSLGSSIAMLAGKSMAKMGTFLEAFLFNPPFLSPPIEKIKDKKLKHGIRFAGSIITAGLTVAVKGHRRTSRSEDPFVALSAWVPNMFVNPGDHICSEYSGYFEHRRKMVKMGVGSIERLATQNSLGGLFLTAIGRESVDSEPLHLLPSANLTTNLSPSSDFKQAHGIHQWWRPDLHFHSKVYIYS